jgi:hypothetical protein
LRRNLVAILLWLIVIGASGIGLVISVLLLLQQGHSTIAGVLIGITTIVGGEWVFYLLFLKDRDKKIDRLIESIQTLVDEIRHDREQREKETKSSS